MVQTSLPDASVTNSGMSASGNKDRADPRELAAAKFYNETANGTSIIKLYKTARAGATVALCSESVKRGELFTLICRTNRNITKAVKEDTATVVGHPINVIHITRNSFCPRIMELTAKYPAIQRIGFIPLPNCDVCKVSECPIRTAFETPTEKVTGFSLTYAKLQSLITSESKKVKGLLEKLLQSRTIILDEIHFLQEAGPVSATLWEKRESGEKTLDPKEYSKLSELSPLMCRFLDKINETLNGIKRAVEELKRKSAMDHYLKHLAISTPNPAHAKAREEQKECEENVRKERERLQQLHPGKTWIEIAEMMPDYSKELGELMKGVLSFSEIVKIQELLINAIKDPQKHGLTEEKILTLTKLLTIINSDTLVISYVRGSEGEQISVQAQDTTLYNSLRTLLSRATTSSKDKRVVFTSATFGALNIQKLLQINNIKDYIWGDPLDTSSKFLVVADKSRISPFNFGKKLKNVMALINALIERYGAENISICTMNKDWSRKIGQESTWYASFKFFSMNSLSIFDKFKDDLGFF